MIAYDLQCSFGHSFEGWFEDGPAYDDQKKEALSHVLFAMVPLFQGFPPLLP